MSFILPSKKDLFFYYADKNGLVHRLQRNIAELTPGDWIHNARPLPSKSKSPYLVSNTVGNDKKNITVFFKDNDGLIYEFRDRAKIKTDEIVLTQLLLKDSGVQASGVPAACKISEIQYVFFKNTKNQLCLLRYADPSVADVELIVFDGTDIDGNPQVLATAGIIHVFFRNAGGYIFEVQYNLETKKWVNVCISEVASQNIDSSTRTPSCIGDPACIERVGTKHHVIHLFYRAADDTLRELFKRPGDQWKNISLRRYVSPADKVSSSPLACFTNEMHVYFMRSDNLLHEIWWDQGKKRWRHATVSKRAMVTTDINPNKLWCVYNKCPHIMFANSTGDICDVWWDEQWKFQSVTAGLRKAQPIALESLQVFSRQVELEESQIPATEKHDDEMDIDKDNLKDMIDVLNTEQFLVPVPPPLPVSKLIEIADQEVKPKPTIIELPLKGVSVHEIQASRPLRIVIVSDTHNYAHRIPMPEGDILLHAGDFTVHGQLHEINAFDTWLGTLNYKHKIVIAGNHEMLPILCRNNLKNCIFLEDKMINVEGINIFGMKWKSKPELIPDDADFLITHVPPKGFGDIIFSGDSRGDDALAHMLRRKPNVKVHIFGHNHEGYGAYYDEHRTYINAATCVGGAKAIGRRQAILVEFHPKFKAHYGVDLVLKFDEILQELFRNNAIRRVIKE